MRRPTSVRKTTGGLAVIVGAIALVAGVLHAPVVGDRGDGAPQGASDSNLALTDPYRGRHFALAFGDSYFTGSEHVTPSQTFGRIALNSLGYSVSIRGHGATGYVTGSHIDGWPNYVSQVSDNSLSHLPTEAIKVIVLEGGINDAIVDADPRLVQLNSNWVMRTLTARYPDAVPVVLGVTPDETGVLSGKRLAISGAIARAAAAAGWHYVDARAMITPGDVARIIGDDRLHPTPAGHRIMAATLQRSLITAGVPAVQDKDATLAFVGR